ncbi:MAG: methionyl-tRNA formyltransferase [Solirubrobacteraceae bacterium]
MRTVYLGTSQFAATVLEHLAAGPHRPQLVITRPDRPRGRGKKLAAPPVAEAARALGLDFSPPEDVNGEETLARMATVEPETVCVCAYGALIREPLLSAHPMLNMHPSLLPRWRGAAPVERAIMAGDAETGVAIMQLTAGLDSGPVALCERTAISEEDTYGTLSTRLADLGSELLSRALDDPPPFAEQPEDGVTYAEKITAEDRRLDPARPAAELARTVRALTPHIGAALELPDGSRLGVRAAREDVSIEVTEGALEAREGRLWLGCREGALELLEVQPPGGRAMPAADYVRGNRGFDRPMR